MIDMAVLEALVLRTLVPRNRVAPVREATPARAHVWSAGSQFPAPQPGKLGMSMSICSSWKA